MLTMSLSRPDAKLTYMRDGDVYTTELIEGWNLSGEMEILDKKHN